MKILGVIFGVLVIIGGVLGGLYLGLWLCLVGGIIEVIHGIQASPLSAFDIAVGILRVLLTSFVTWVTILGVAGVGVMIVTISASRSGRSTKLGNPRW